MLTRWRERCLDFYSRLLVNLNVLVSKWPPPDAPSSVKEYEMPPDVGMVKFFRTGLKKF